MVCGDFNISPSTVGFNIWSYFGCPLTGLESYASAITASTSVLAIVQPCFAFHSASSIGGSNPPGELASALDVYVSVGIAPLTFIQTGVTLVESAHNDSVSRVGTTCPLDVYPKYRGIVTQFTSDGQRRGWSYYHDHYIPVLLLPAASKFIVDAL